MLDQELIYQNLQSKNYGHVITLLHTYGNRLNNESTVDFAINIFLNEFFKVAGEKQTKNIDHDLDILFMCHTQNKYRLKNEHLLKLIHLLYPRVSPDFLYTVAIHFQEDPICKEILIIHNREKNSFIEQKRLEKNKLNINQIKTGEKFTTEIGQARDIFWVKVFLRSNELLDVIAKHLQKLSSVSRVNVTLKENGNSDLTIYSRRPYSIVEVEEEVILTLENYFSRNPLDPIFKYEVISGISDIAYFQILDYILKLGIGLEGFRSLSLKMGEENYRDYFVNYLDSLSHNHTATAETFHAAGKSDILIRNQNKEVLLVAECKLWEGKIYLNNAINQLFTRYISWRDGKAAILIFNTKVKGFSSLINTAVETVKSHKWCVEFNGKRSETSYSFTFQNHQDANKFIKLELLLFNFV